VKLEIEFLCQRYLVSLYSVIFIMPHSADNMSYNMKNTVYSAVMSCHHNHNNNYHHHWLYILGWALASSRKCHQRPLSWTAFHQFLRPSFLVSSSTPSIHLDIGRPHPCWPPGFFHNIFLGNSLSSIHTTWPAHLSWLDFITLNIFGFSTVKWYHVVWYKPAHISEELLPPSSE